MMTSPTRETVLYIGGHTQHRFLPRAPSAPYHPGFWMHFYVCVCYSTVPDIAHRIRGLLVKQIYVLISAYIAEDI